MMVELMLPCLSTCPAASEPMHWLWRPPMKIPMTCRMSVSILEDGKLRKEKTKGSAGRGRYPTIPVSAISSTSTPSRLS